MPEGLPPAERRRVGHVVKLALAVGMQATRGAGIDPAPLSSVFSSSGGDGQNCHELCETLVSDAPQLSPTRFHNSVHNAAAGYWSIATGAQSSSNAVCAFDASFAAGLLEALAQVAIEHVPVLLVAYDAPYPQPLAAKRPIPHAFGVAFVLTPEPTSSALARIAASLTDAPADCMEVPELEQLRLSVPAARSLPLLRQLAREEPACVSIDYVGHRRVAVEVDSCG
jgi:hypothetical protein